MEPNARELVDEVDAEGRTVGVISRHEMRERRLPHRCTYVLVFDRSGQIFVHLRTSTKDVFPGYWDVTVGGVLAAGESFAEGTAREIREELGIDAVAEELFPFRYADPATIVHARVYRLVHDGPFQLQPEEIVRGEFIPVGTALQRSLSMPFCPDGLEVLRLYRQNLGEREHEDGQAVNDHAAGGSGQRVIRDR